MMGSVEAMNSISDVRLGSFVGYLYWWIGKNPFLAKKSGGSLCIIFCDKKNKKKCLKRGLNRGFVRRG
jgi:hypothetical protein